MRIAVTIDVEEEGLFSGRYAPMAEGVTNVECLKKLEWLTRDLGLPLTLLTDYPVATDAGCADILCRWREELGAEIGAHLHPWNTPPLAPDTNPLDSSSMPRDLIRTKIATLKNAIRQHVGVTPSSFRMGRWDFSDTVRQAIIDEEFTVDSSVVPLKVTPAGDTYFNAQADPFWLDDTKLFEVPLTMVPIIPWATRTASAMGLSVKRNFSHFGAVGIQPVWFSLPAMKLAARLHEKRGGEVLTLFLHSSELLPGGSPHFPTEASIAAFLDKLRAFFDWLGAHTKLTGCTLSDLRNYPGERP